MAIHRGWLFLHVLNLVCIHSVTSQKLLVIYMDGMRWDYINQRPSIDNEGMEGGFHLSKRRGAFIERLRPVTPTHCLPNIHTAFSGRHPSLHGILGDQMFDISSNFFFDYHAEENPLSQFRNAPKSWWNRSRPLWDTLAIKHRKRSSIYFLPSAYELRQLQNWSFPDDLILPFKRDINWTDFRDGIFEAIGRLRRNMTDLAVVYSNALDRAGHFYGPTSVHVERKIEQLDKLLRAVLFEVMLEPHLGIHVILMSDHGMQGISENREVNLEWLILRSTLRKVINSGSTASIWPLPEYLQSVYNRLIHGDHYRIIKADKNPKDSRTPPIILLAEPGYLFISKDFIFPRTDYHNGGYPQAGYHGYQASRYAMHTPMFVFGEKIQSGVQLKTMDVINIYQLMCHLLEIPPEPNNGTFQELKPLLKSSIQNSNRRAQIHLDNQNSKSSTTVVSAAFTLILTVVVNIILI